MVAAHIAFGQRGEEIAADWYRRHGYAVVDRNWRCPIGEIDLVLRRGRLLVVAEVKARRSDVVRRSGARRHAHQTATACAVSPRRGWPTIASAAASTSASTSSQSPASRRRLRGRVLTVG